MTNIKHPQDQKPITSIKFSCISNFNFKNESLKKKYGKKLYIMKPTRDRLTGK